MRPEFAPKDFLTMTADPARSDYQLLQLLGRGYTSLVYVATDPQGREVALKVPLEDLMNDKDAAQQFANEVRMGLKLKHPHIVEAYAGRESGEQAFLSAKYYREGPLSDRLEAGRLSIEEALRILADVASALVYLHELGAIHQDVKPQNIYLDGGRAALGDLGTAYFVAQGGKTSGSPFYMAPEVYRGEDTSPASDVYSLGVMAYEMLAGQRPYLGEKYEDLMMAHLNSYPAKLNQKNPDIPSGLGKLVEKCLAKNPESRPSAQDVLQGFRVLLNEPEETPAPEVAAPKLGRYASAPTAAHTPEVAAPAAEENKGKASRWNPFKRKK